MRQFTFAMSIVYVTMTKPEEMRDVLLKFLAFAALYTSYKKVARICCIFLTKSKSSRTMVN